MKELPGRGLPAEHGGAPREPVGRSAVDASGHGGVMGQVDDACVRSQRRRLVGRSRLRRLLSACSVDWPAAQLLVAFGRGGGSGGGSQDPVPR